MSSRAVSKRLPTPQAVASAYRDWLLVQSVEEATRRCERILAVKSELSQYVRDLTAGWSTQKLRALMSGRIKGRKWMYQAATARTAEEEAACEEFEWPILKFRTGGPSAVYSSAIAGPVEVDVSKLGVADLRTRFVQGDFRLDKRAMRKQLREVLVPTLGRSHRSPGCWRYTRNFGGVSVCTDVDFGSAGGGQFRYWHLIVAGDGAENVGLTSERILLSNICLFNLFGLETTQWAYLTDAEVPAAAEQLAALCGWFLGAVPGIMATAVRVQERLDDEASRHLH